MKTRVDELEALRATKKEMGGPERVARQRSRGKLDARARAALLFDPNSFDELGLLAASEGNLPTEEQEGRPTPGDGVITGFGLIEGRPVGAAIYDFTVLGGSIDEVGERKVTRLRDLALKHRVPLVWLIDSAGARLDASSTEPRRIARFADTGYLFREQVVMSGVVPQVGAMLGPGAAGTAYIPALADYVPMVKGKSSIAIGGPALVAATVGEQVTEEELGGSQIHCEVSGVGDGEFDNDEACIAAVREYLSFFPSHCEDKPPRREPSHDSPQRREDALLTVVPTNPRQAFDMHKVIDAIVDDRRFFEMKPRFARNILTGLARIDGYPVGIVGNNSKFYGGVLDVNASDKAARFVNLCDAFNIPLLFLQDVPGFMVGTKVEQQGIIRHGAKLLYAVASATVPKFTVVVRKGYGAGYYVMNGRAFEPDLLVAWPGAEIGVMGPEGMVAIGARKLLEQAESPEAARALQDEMARALKAQISIYRTAAMGMVDDVIDPRETRPLLARALHRTRNKTVERPFRKREVSPV